VRSIRAVVAAALIGYKFACGETLSQLNLHYRTLGSAERDDAGEIVNGV
jgi:hypothetical protein